MKELIKEIERNNRNDEPNPLLQTVVLIEESANLQRTIINYIEATSRVTVSGRACGKVFLSNVLSDCLNDIKNAIGDVFIELVVLHNQSVTSDFELDFKYYENVHNSSIENSSDFDLGWLLITEIGLIQNDINNEIRNHYCENGIIEILHNLCKRYGLVLQECVESALNKREEG